MFWRVKDKGRLAVPFIVLFLGFFCSCGSGGTEVRIRKAVQSQLALYPDLTLIDLYKSFFQAEFGAGHIVADTVSAGGYLDYELTVPDTSDIFFEPIGPDSSYYRVHLNCVQKGFISRQQLFDAFLSGVSPVQASQLDNWKVTWQRIVSVIDGMHLDMDDYDEDKAAIEHLLSSGEYAVHHSDVFSVKYNPHYRIVRGDIFRSKILPYLPQGR